LSNFKKKPPQEKLFKIKKNIRPKKIKKSKEELKKINEKIKKIKITTLNLLITN
jgi:hypothetical protein